MTDEIQWHGPDELRAFLRPVDEIRPHPTNPRRGDIQLVATSLKRFGQEKPVITDRDDHDLIVAGNHTYYAVRELGWTHVAVIEMWSEAGSGEKYLLIDNATSDNSSYDHAELLALLDRYEGDDLAATGFTTDERDRIRAELEEERRAAAEFQAGQAEPEPSPAAPRQGTIVRNVLVTLPEEERWRQFTTRLNVLRREWSIVDVSACIAEAVRREKQRLYERAA